MMFLIAKMFVYLLVSAGIGVAAGWLLRNFQAQQSEEQARRQMHDSKAKLPQLESLLRGRDEQIAKLKDEVQARRKEVKEQINATKEAEKALIEQRRETNRWKQTAEARQEMTIDDADDQADDLISALSAEISVLKAELAQRPVSASTGDADVLNAELDASRLQNRQLETRLRGLQDDLERQRRSVVELERERELQNKSLQVLHQQLELERSREAANG